MCLYANHPFQSHPAMIIVVVVDLVVVVSSHLDYYQKLVLSSYLAVLLRF